MENAQNAVQDFKWPKRFDAEALEEVARRYGHELLLYGFALTGHRQDAEDALQEALLRIAFRRVRSISNLRAYLFRVVRNAALNIMRKKRSTRKRERAAATAEVFFEKRGESSEEVGALNRAVSSLRPEQREVVTMKIWGKATFDEIARRLEIPRDTAASRYRYGIAALRKAMRSFTDGT